MQENLSQTIPVVKEMQVVLAAVLERYLPTSLKDDFQSILLSLSTLMFIKATVSLEGMFISVILNFEFTAL